MFSQPGQQWTVSHLSSTYRQVFNPKAIAAAFAVA